MAVTTYLVANSNADDAAFRAWGLALHNAIAACGLVQTADSGQINWATVTAPGALNTKQGYEIWRFADSLQATAAVYIRFDYGSSTLNQYNPGIWWRLGTGSNGSGTLTGLTTTEYHLGMASTSASATMCRVSGDTNRLLFALWCVAGKQGILFSIERTKSAAGIDTSEGILTVSWDPHSTDPATMQRQQAYTFAAGESTVENSLGALLPTFGTGATGTATALYPIFLSKGTFFNPLLNVLLAFESNITPGTQISFTYYGSVRKFMPLASTGATLAKARGSINCSFLVRDE